MVEHRQRVHAHADARGVHTGQADHAGRGHDDGRPGVTVEAQDRLGAVHDLRQVHVLGQHRWASVPCRHRQQAAGVPRLGRSREPPLLVHQVQRQDALEGDPGRVGDPAYLLQQVGRVPPDRGHEARRRDQIGDEPGRRTAEARGDIRVPALEQRTDLRSQRLAVGVAALAPAAAAVHDQVGRHRHRVRYYPAPRHGVPRVIDGGYPGSNCSATLRGCGLPACSSSSSR